MRSNSRSFRDVPDSMHEPSEAKSGLRLDRSEEFTFCLLMSLCVILYSVIRTEVAAVLRSLTYTHRLLPTSITRGLPRTIRLPGIKLGCQSDNSPRPHQIDQHQDHPYSPSARCRWLVSHADTVDTGQLTLRAYCTIRPPRFSSPSLRAFHRTLT